MLWTFGVLNNLFKVNSIDRYITPRGVQQSLPLLICLEEETPAPHENTDVAIYGVGLEQSREDSNTPEYL